MQATQFNRADLGFWPREAGPVSTHLTDLQRAFGRLHEAFYVLIVDGKPAVARPEEGATALGPLVEPPMAPGTAPDGFPVLAYCPACLPERLGDASFCADHGLRFPYVAGAMANGVGSVEIVEAMSRAGMIGFFGAAGLPLQRVESAIDRIQNSLQSEDGYRPYGANLIHSPAEPGLEDATVDLYLRKGVRLVSAAAYLRLTPALIRYRVHGIHRDPNGKIVTPNRVIAKVSRVEIARRFFSPPPEKFLARLVLSGEITAEQAKLAEKIPVAQDLTAEADSGGHTDNRPFLTLLPTMIALRDELQEEFGYEQRLRVGAAGGIATPSGAAAAFSMGAAYILTGTINQACEESGTSPLVRRMLREARQADVAMAPAADMFEMGVKVQVLKRGTMFPMRAAKLYDIYRACESLEHIPSDQKKMLEADYFRGSFDEIWRQTEAFFAAREPGRIEKAHRDPKHKMALVFRWYLGQSSGWANEGREDRKVDFQVWCGPAMGAFNQWTAGSPLENQEERKVEAIALNLLVGAAVLTRVQSVRAQGVQLPAALSRVRPMALDQAKERLNY